MNLIVYKDYTFENADIVSGIINLETSMVSEALSADTFTFIVENRGNEKADALYSLTDALQSADGDALYSSKRDISDVINYKYGEPVLVYRDDELQGRFFVEYVEQISKNQYKFTCGSTVRMLTTVKHYGGVYENKNIVELISEIMATAGIEPNDYSVSDELSDVVVSGWLPIGSCRDSLQECCFATGCSIFKDADGKLTFAFNNNIDATVIEKSQIYATGGKVKHLTPATSVTVLEHAFYITSLDEEKELYADDITVENKPVPFGQPMHSLTTTGTLTIVESGANYAIVSGAGTLIGKAYTHTTKEVTVQTGVSSSPKEIRISKPTLVTALNSYYVALRVANYYASPDEVACGIVQEKQPNYTGQLIRFEDPFGRERQGYIKTMKVNMSETWKADCTIATDFAPGPFGSNFIDQLILWSGNGEGAPDKNMVSLHGLRGVFRPSDYGLQGERVRVVVFSSSKGGQGGANGGNAYGENGEEWGARGAGKGGKAGEGAKGIYYFSQDIVLSESSYNISLGEGGEGGLIGNREGGDCQQSVFGSINSGLGNYTEGGYYNLLTKRMYGIEGADGVSGGDGGNLTGTATASNSNIGERSRSGGDASEWKGGEGGRNYYRQEYFSGLNTGYFTISISGGNGGGACLGANGQDGTDTTSVDSLGRGGDGASVPEEYFPKQTILGVGGFGGSGGGGGALGGSYDRWYNSNIGWRYLCGGHGVGGTGCGGGKGSDGFILILSPKEIEVV